MAELIPIPIGVLATRLFSELEQKKAAFGLPAGRFFHHGTTPDLSVSVHGHRASSPFGPAAGPHTQLAQNIVLAWLSGGRVIELKTVQIKDDLVIPRPCIDMQTIGYNVEWSQELRLEQSLEEYVKASMLIDMLKASGLGRDFGDTVFDMSVGYDLAGIGSERVRAFMAGLLDARATVERLRAQIPSSLGALRDLPFASRISDTITLSTFHGCPPDEIEAIAAFLLKEIGLHVVVKLNPTLLGREEVREVFRNRLGYAEPAIPDAAFEKDAKWEQVTAFAGRLGALAESLKRGFGVKFSNTLLVNNHKAFFPPSEKEMYLSGAPLHVLAMLLVRRFRRAFGDRFPVSFSGGIDANNFADAVALGLKPVSACSDLLKSGSYSGYARGARYLASLAKRMNDLGAASIDEFALRACGNAEAALANLSLAPGLAAKCRAALAAGTDLRAAAGDAFAGWVAACRLLNTETYIDRMLDDPRYTAAHNAKPPKKVGSRLRLFDCLTCDKCIPVCPNNANFTLAVARGSFALERLAPAGSGWAIERHGELAIGKPWQIGVFADGCNECGNCDVFCPEDGGPYLSKPLFFGSVAAWARTPERDGFAFEPIGQGLRMHGRFDGRAVSVEPDGKKLRYRGEGFDLRLDVADPAASAEGSAASPVDLTPLRIMEHLREAITAPEAINFVNAALAES
ncbi:MAG: glutamate synthase [Betaproteobacteria bacterium]|nr:glutamate synthase [Betaproteobacteria bacterium]